MFKDNFFKGRGRGRTLLTNMLKKSLVFWCSKSKISKRGTDLTQYWGHDGHSVPQESSTPPHVSSQEVLGRTCLEHWAMSPSRSHQSLLPGMTWARPDQLPGSSLPMLYPQELNSSPEPPLQSRQWLRHIAVYAPKPSNGFKQSVRYLKIEWFKGGCHTHPFFPVFSESLEVYWKELGDSVELF